MHQHGQLSYLDDLNAFTQRSIAPILQPALMVSVVHDPCWLGGELEIWVMARLVIQAVTPLTTAQTQSR